MPQVMEDFGPILSFQELKMDVGVERICHCHAISMIGMHLLVQ